MSKRPYYPQQNGDRKKAKLDVTISDHNFPLSQNVHNKEPEQDNWGDDNDDEILLLASQACEDAYNDMSLPDYSLLQPVSTSTQLFDPGPSTSKTTFSFKKPSALPPSAITSNLKDKCNRISSPLPGISTKVLPKTTDCIDLTDDLIFNDKIFKGQDSDLLYKQLLQLQEENAKLKSENGKLLEKCVTKEGEASILRTQLKTSHVAVDNARMDKIKAQEKIKMEWTDKLAATNNQMHELRTQLDFKNLEIISIKERCKLLESNKIKLTQVTVPSNDANLSQRMNSSFSVKDASIKKPKLASSSVQTDHKAHFLKLNKTCRSEPSQLTSILPLVLEPTNSHHSLLEYNEKLQKHTDLSQNKCRVYSTFHRIPNSGGIVKVKSGRSMASLHEALTDIVAGTDDGKAFSNIVTMLCKVLQDVLGELELIAKKATTAFHKQMDERYIETSATYLVLTEQHLLRGSPLYKEEQAILARRMTCVVASVLQRCADRRLHNNRHSESSQLMGIVMKICTLLDSTSCALLYSGLLLSMTNLIPHFPQPHTKTVLKCIISCRPMPLVSCQLLKIVQRLSGCEGDGDSGRGSGGERLVAALCPRTSAGNLKLDYDQGVLLYKKDSCHLQVLLKQVESSLRCVDKQRLAAQAGGIATQLIALHTNINKYCSAVDKERSPGCDCHLTLLQVMVYALRILAVMLKDTGTSDDSLSSTRLLAVCRSGVHVLYGCTLRDVEFSSQLAHDEGHLLEFCEIMKTFPHSEVYESMLSELSSTFQSVCEEAPPFHRAAWITSFDTFTIAD